MARKIEPKPHRILGKSSPKHEAELRELRKKLDAEKPALIAEVEQRRAKLTKIFTELRVERERLGFSLADMAEKTGMAREVIHRLETRFTPNPTINTIQRYAEALGLEIRLELVHTS